MGLVSSKKTTTYDRSPMEWKVGWNWGSNCAIPCNPFFLFFFSWVVDIPFLSVNVLDSLSVPLSSLKEEGGEEGGGRNVHRDKD